MQAAPRRSWNPLHEVPLLPPTRWNRIAAGLFSATALLLLGLLIVLHVRYGSLQWRGIVYLELPALLYLVGLALGACRVRPRKSLRGFFLISFLPTLLLSLVLFLFACLSILNDVGWVEEGSALAFLSEQVGTLAFWGVLGSVAWPILLLVFARRALLLFCTGIGGSIWMLATLGQWFDGLIRALHATP